jgi:hypothetical protein
LTPEPRTTLANFDEEENKLGKGKRIHGIPPTVPRKPDLEVAVGMAGKVRYHLQLSTVERGILGMWRTQAGSGKREATKETQGRHIRVAFFAQLRGFFDPFLTHF